MEIFNSVVNLFMAIATITIAFTAYRGLNSWKDQHKSKNEYELAKNLLSSLYELRNAFYVVREPIYLIEIKTPEEAPNLSEEERQFDGRLKEREDRWKHVDEAAKRINKYSPLAEALWEQNLTDEIRQINALHQTLLDAIQLHLTILNPEMRVTERQEAELRTIEERYPNICQIQDLENDKFNAELNKHIEKIRKFLKPKMRL